MCEGGQKAQTFSYKMNKFWGCNAQHGDYSQQYCIAYMKVARREDLKSSHDKECN